MKKNENEKPSNENSAERKSHRRDKIVELHYRANQDFHDAIEPLSKDNAAPVTQNAGKGGDVVIVYREYSELKHKDKLIKYLSFHDQLTGLYNRRFFQEEIKRLDKERNIPIAIVMADINGLKLTNDAYGYKAGDELIKKVAGIISRECRADDIIARIGGDKFSIILPRTNPDQARRFAARISEAMAYEKPDKVVPSIAIGYAVKQDAVDNIDDIFRNAEDDMNRQKLSESSNAKSRTIVLILNALYERNALEMSHSKRVGQMCEELASQMLFKRDDANQMRAAGILHDIGKIRINESILEKPEELNETEWQEVMKHPETGYRILSSVNGFAEIAVYVKQHQERWDGLGYPNAMKGDEISVQARIISVASAYAAMTSEKPYGKAMSEDQAILEIKRNSGSQFDPEVAQIFVEKVLKKIW